MECVGLVSFLDVVPRAGAVCSYAPMLVRLVCIVGALALAAGQTVVSTDRVWEVDACPAKTVFDASTLECRTCVQSTGATVLREPSSTRLVRNSTQIAVALAHTQTRVFTLCFRLDIVPLVLVGGCD